MSPRSASVLCPLTMPLSLRFGRRCSSLSPGPTDAGKVQSPSTSASTEAETNLASPPPSAQAGETGLSASTPKRQQDPARMRHEREKLQAMLSQEGSSLHRC
eukprot:Tamp_18803.p2 GENE.Tamp_18803~~Tamp_18803.p2  ORF type:complete len:102 (+),score=1.77 Tamp_18803:114-419(+)